MLRLITPVVLIIIGVAAFFTYISPTYDEIKGIQEEISSYDEALDQTQELQDLRDELLTRYNSFEEGNIERLNKLLPTHVDNVRLIMDIDSIASKYGMDLRNVAISEPTSAGSEDAGSQELGRIHLSFAVASSYENFKLFLSDLERSLRLVDVNSISFSSSAENLYEYRVGINTYWIK